MRIFISRLGAFGDVVITTPLVRYLKSCGHEIVYMTSDRGMEVLKGNPHIEKLIYHEKDSVPIDALGDHIKWMAKKHKCERVIDLSESIEVALSLHPRDAGYNLPKYDRRRTQERNFYEYTFEHVGYPDWKSIDLKPELFFDQSELDEAQSYLKPGFNLLIGLAGSGSNKAWPWSEALVGSIIQEYGDKVHIITVGDERCRLIEPEHPSVTNLSGKVPMRISMALTSLVDCVICPDTGLAHAAGCYDTPKIIMACHNTAEVISKHFKNCFFVEADETRAECAPCFRLIYNMQLQCPIDEATGGCMGMSRGVKPEIVFDRFKEIYAGSSKVLP